MKLTIDGQEIEAQAGTTILEAARGVDIYIPSLCSHPDLPQAEGIQAAKVIYQGERK
ncbi:MAG: (2Fe-2S)-binding protein, partial [Proteobacteria bacterium]|nr:(2Fe-2S)-binding protein [Pseudomonadota bacterium]